MAKILYLTPGCFDKGGISRYNRYQITALRELEGSENIKVFSLLAPAEGDFEDPFQVDWHGWGATKLSKLSYIFKVLCCVYIWKPNVIWLGHVNLTEILVRFKLLKKAKTVLNIYGLEVWSGLRPKVELGFKSVDKVISDCHYTANYVEDNGFRKLNTTEVIWDCVNLEKFKPLLDKDNDLFYHKYNLPNPKSNPWILSLGRISNTAAHKGYERLLEVFSKVAINDLDAVLVFGGKGDMIDKLKGLAHDLKIAERVYFSGMVHEDDLPKFYRACRVFSLVSDRGIGRGEGIPLTPLEAMACGAPIIVGNHDGSQEAVFNDKNGYTIDPFDFVAHKNAILSLLKEEKEYQIKSKAALEISIEHFSYDHFKDKHRKFLKKIN